MNRGFESWLWIVAHIPRKSEGGNEISGKIENLNAE
jgi:hypothetical protein